MCVFLLAHYNQVLNGLHLAVPSTPQTLKLWKPACTLPLLNPTLTQFSTNPSLLMSFPHLSNSR